VPRMHLLRPRRTTRFAGLRAGLTLFSRVLLLCLLFVAALPPTPAQAAPRLILPTPPGQSWKIIQGYACGTHNAWDRYSLDLASTVGGTIGAPIRAAADGRIWAWTAASGTLILDHGGNFYTMYTHLSSAVSTSRGRFIPRGAVLGYAGERQTVGTPHLHFTAFTGAGSRNWRSVPLSFAEGYDLPEVGGCNQHGGKELIASGELLSMEPEIDFESEAKKGTWYNSDQRIEFTVEPFSKGFSQAWNRDPEADKPMFPDIAEGYVQLSWAGEGFHTIHVRGWGLDGKQVVEQYGPIGYDITPPQAKPSDLQQEIPANLAVTLRWDAATDNASGVAGYRVYLGADPAGTSEWYTESAAIETPALNPGLYVLRVQPVDKAGNIGEWVTVGKVLSAPPEEL
jgi:hypothetical protein